MTPSTHGVVPPGRNRAIEELVCDQSLARELADVVASPRNDPNWDAELARDLAEKLRIWFDVTIPELVFPLKEEGEHRVKRSKPNSPGGSEGSVHSSCATARRDRRGCYKRRSKGETWSEFSPGMNADVHQWRKYGQKSIQGATHPRHYYRCTHKPDRGCQATKQVQQFSDDPITFRTVYQGHHTCNDDRRLQTSETVFNDIHRGSNDHGSNSSSFLVSFGHGSVTDPPPPKKEETGEDPSGDKGEPFVPSASSGSNYCGLLGLQGDVMSAPSFDLGDAVSVSHHDSYWDWDDTVNFMLDFGASIKGSGGCDL
ncbi:hypothetical protein MLD38_030018 [Melastoma candidum]|uniref:Uncharacterized protein n=1 Tax=Melastoma candidum TaxID=119954 RepID=A0ACB9MK83_9MYRT|nr:hypothetical protein MLD38_030018 [Melastoma candidum]